MIQFIPFGKYLLLEKVSTGGMAEVYKAKEFGADGFERLLAVKRILNSIAEDEVFISMFIDEAKIAGQLNHPQIAQIFDLGKVDGSYFIAMEYVSGKDLKAIWEQMVRSGQKVDVFMACYVVMRICEGLQYAHTKRDAAGNELHIVHRDISPQNVLLSYEGEAKIIDFGIAKAQNKSNETQVGVLKGKVSYMAPEQVRGLHIDHRADVFSLGIVLYELLTLQRLFLGESDFDTLEKIRKVEMSPPTLYNPFIPRELEDIVLKALARSPDERFQDASEMRDALERFMRNHSAFYGQRELASFMKTTFAADIELERQKQDHYRQIRPENYLPSASVVEVGLAWGEDENTSHYSRPVPFEDINPSADMGGHGAGPLLSSEPPSASGYLGGPLPEVVANHGGKEGTTELDLADLDLDLPFEGDEDEDPTMEFDRFSAGLGGSPFAAGPLAAPMAQPVQPVPTPAPMPAKPAPAPVAALASAPMQAGPVSAGPSSLGGLPERPEPSLGGPGPMPMPSPRPRAPEGPPSPMLDGGPPSGRPQRSSTGPLMAVVGVMLLLVLIGGAAAFLLPRLLGDTHQARLSFRVNNAETVKITVDDKLAYEGPAKGDISLEGVEPGKRTITIASPGFKTKTDTLELESGSEFLIPINLEKASALGQTGVSVRVQPAGVTVLLDGQEIKEPGPFSRRDLTPGEHTIVFKKEGYQEQSQTFSLSDGQMKEIDLSLKLAAFALKLESAAPGAEAEVFEKTDDGTRSLRRGPLPMEITDLDPAKAYEVEVKAPGYEAQRKAVPQGEEAKRQLTFNLAAAVAAKDNGQAGKEPSQEDKNAAAERRTERLEQARQLERERLERLREERRAAQARAQEKETPKVTPPKEVTPKETQPAAGGFGVVLIASKPQARISVDGKDIGYTPRANYRLPVGNHRITLYMESINVTRNYTVNITADKPARVIGRP